MPYDTDPGDGLPPAETGPSPRQQPPSHHRPGRMERLLGSLSNTQGVIVGLTAVVVAGGTLWVAVAGLIDRINGEVPTPTSQQPPASTTSTTLDGEVFRETDGAPVVVASCIDLDSQNPTGASGQVVIRTSACRSGQTGLLASTLPGWRSLMTSETCGLRETNCPPAINNNGGNGPQAKPVCTQLRQAMGPCTNRCD
jgi:hypothetical protein